MFRSKSTAWIVGAICCAALALPAVAQDNGVIKGKVIFKGDATLKQYKRQKINTSKDPNCKKSKKSIGSYRVILNKKTDPLTIRNVMVSVKEGLGDRTYEPPTDPVELTQAGCEYTPHVFGIMAGQPLKVTNGDPTNHNIHFLPKVNQEHNFSQPKQGMQKELTLLKEDTFRIKCDVHPWMGCYTQVFDHPFFAVTGKDGTYELKGLPPGKFVIEAWHETFGTLQASVEVASGETKVVDLTFEPEK